MNAARLYIGNLSYKTDESALREWIEGFGLGVASVSIITDKDTGRSKGFGFVDLQDSAEMATAIEQAHGKSLDGRAITVDRAKDKEPRRGGGGGGRDRDRGDRDRGDRHNRY